MNNTTNKNKNYINMNNTTNKNYINMNNTTNKNYIIMTNNFINQFYTTNMNSSKMMYKHDAKITFNSNECIGFENFNNLLISKNIYFFNSNIKKYISQPLSNNNVLINVWGQKSVNNKDFYDFYDTFIISYNFNQIIINNYISCIFFPI